MSSSVANMITWLTRAWAAQSLVYSIRYITEWSRNCCKHIIDIANYNCRHEFNVVFRERQSRKYYAGSISPCMHVDCGGYNINAQSASLRSLLAAESREPRSKSPADKNSDRNLRTKTPQAEASGKCSSICFAPPPPPTPSNKAGWAFTVNCSGIIL